MSDVHIARLASEREVAVVSALGGKRVRGHQVEILRLLSDGSWQIMTARPATRLEMRMWELLAIGGDKWEAAESSFGD